MTEWQPWAPCPVTCGVSRYPRALIRVVLVRTLHSGNVAVEAAILLGREARSVRRSARDTKSGEIAPCLLVLVWISIKLGVLSVRSSSDRSSMDEMDSLDGMQRHLRLGLETQRAVVPRRHQQGGHASGIRLHRRRSLPRRGLQTRRLPKCEKGHFRWLLTRENASVDGAWTNWLNWGECSVLCGQHGKQTRRRYCAQPLPQFGGEHCQGEGEERRSCVDNPPCPRKRRTTVAIYVANQVSQATASGRRGASGARAACLAARRALDCKRGAGTRRWKPRTEERSD